MSKVIPVALQFAIRFSIPIGDDGFSLALRGVTKRWQHYLHCPCTGSLYLLFFVGGEKKKAKGGWGELAKMETALSIAIE